MAATERPHFLTIPPEIREEVFKLVLHPDANRIHFEDEYSDYDFGPALTLFRVNRQVYFESRKVFRDLNTFVRIETPWAEAQHYVGGDGKVPIVITRDKTLDFADHSLTVAIEPYEYAFSGPAQGFIILADDLPKFTRTWFYSDLSHQTLNPALQLKLLLWDPYRPAWEEKRMPRWLQQKLLLPFGEVKRLFSTEVGGDVKSFASIEKELREMQATPPPSPEHCLREATRIKFDGNAELVKGNYRKALEIYKDAWRAMHIIVTGRERQIHADDFFHVTLKEEPYKNKNGSAERLTIRVHLVANTCQAYLKLEEYEMCRFWGMRTIHMLLAGRDHDPNVPMRPEQEAVLGWPAANQMGKIYYRTAVACKMLDDESEARRLLRVATIYLPNDEKVRDEIAATALRIG